MLYEGQNVYYVGFDNQYLNFLDVLKIYILDEEIYVIKINSDDEWVFSGYIDRSCIKTKEEIFQIIGVEKKIE